MKYTKVDEQLITELVYLQELEICAFDTMRHAVYIQFYISSLLSHPQTTPGLSSPLYLMTLSLRIRQRTIQRSRNIHMKQRPI